MSRALRAPLGIALLWLAGCAALAPPPEPSARDPAPERLPEDTVTDPVSGAEAAVNAMPDADPPASEVALPEVDPESAPPPTPSASAPAITNAVTTPPPEVLEPPADTSTAPRDDEIPALCKEIGGLLGSVGVDECLASNLVHGAARSHGDRALAWVEFPAGLRDASRVLVIGGIHGDEYSSISLVFRWIERLREEHDGGRAWRLIPAANPDGLLGAQPARRTNARGVDLNRNFATPDWAHEADTWWIEETRRDPRRRPGDAPASERETRWLQAFIAEWEPDVIVAVHAPHALLDFDASARGRLEPPERLGFLRLQPLGTYPGSLGRYGSLALGVPVLTLELPWAGIMPSAEDQTALWRDLAQWLGTHLPTTAADEQLSGP